ncbi:hypothetical protein FQA39_LY09766 [Lamprigera yunnana]|nr:hypothetical protein FQA39_LY09766 [Lamprigera yunnana]
MWMLYAEQHWTKAVSLKSAVERLYEKLGALEFDTDHEANYEDSVNILRFAFEERLMSYKVTPLNDNHVKVLKFMAEFQNKICMLIKNPVRKPLSVKINMELFGLYALK